MQTAIHEFLLYCRIEKDLSPKTISAYNTDLRQLTEFLQEKEKLNEITRYDLRNYLASLSQLKPKSIRRKIASAKALFNFLEFEDRITSNPFRKMRMRIKEDKKLPAVMSIKEITKILQKAYSQEPAAKENSYSFFEALRNSIVIELLFSTGARVSEIAGLRIEHVHLESGGILIRGKGRKERLVHVCNSEPIALLKKYHALVKEKMKAAGGYFLVNRFNKKLSDQSIRNIVKKLVDKAGINRRITPHVFRHTFATLLLEKDVDIRYIQHLLGHSSILTTQLYTHVNRAKQKQILRAKHPRKDIMTASVISE